MSSTRIALLASASLLIATPALAQATTTVPTGDAWYPTPNEETAITTHIVIEEGAALVASEKEGFSGPEETFTLEDPTVLTFAPGLTFDNDGYILIGPDDRSTSWSPGVMEGELRLVGVSEFLHSGSILLGVMGYSYPSSGDRIDGNPIEATDGAYDDMMTFQDGTWVGEGGRVVFDVDTSRIQTDCTRESDNQSWDFQAADCLRIVDSTVEGQTFVTVAQLIPGDRGRLTQQIMDQGIVLIETPGSTVTADNFALDPAMRGYNATSDSLDKGLYQYVLLFDEEAEQFKLFGTLSGAAYQLPMAATVAHDIWRVSAGSWMERQAHVRGGIEPGTGGGVWLRFSGEQADREVSSTSTLGGLPYTVDNTHDTKTYAVTGGVDLISAESEDRAYAVGVMLGYGHSDVDYEVSTNTQAFDAWTGGVYASVSAGGLFVDAVVNYNKVIIDTDAPGFDLLPEGTILSSRLNSLGGQVEAGWRMDLSEGFFVEPLASVSYIRSTMDDLDIEPDDRSRPGLVVSYEDPSSFRAGIGGRAGMESDLGPVRTQLSLLGRIWNELEAKNTASIHNLAFPDDPDIRVTDDFSGQFSEIAVGASVWSQGGGVSGFFNLGGKFGEDYDAQTLSAGVRVTW